MANKVIKNRPLWLNAYDFASSFFAMAVDYGADEKENTSLADVTHTMQGGLKTLGIAGEGFWNETTLNPVDSTLFSQVGQTDLITYADDATEGEIAYFAELNQASYVPGAAVGEMFQFTFSGSGAGDLIRGTIELKDILTATSTSTGRQLGAVAAGQKIWAAMHVTAVSGTSPTFDALVVSDDNGSFSSATTRITFTQATAITSEILSATGPITDDYWRIDYTIGGTDTPTFTVVVTLGII